MAHEQSPARRVQMGIEEAGEYLNRWEITRRREEVQSAIDAMRAAADHAERYLYDVI